MVNDGNNDIVWVTPSEPSPPALKALRAPTFIIKKGDVYYVTEAVLEYDASQADTQEETEGCEEVRDLFDDATDEERREAVEITLGAAGFAATHTRPG